MVLKGLFKQEEDLEKNETKNQNSLFKGFDPEKFAKMDTRDKENESDTETVSLDSQEFKYASYFSSIKRQIESVWSYPEQAATRGLQRQLLLQFILDRSGKLVDISSVISSEHEIFDNAALDAVKTASPYNPFPEKIQENKLKIIASFKNKPFYTSYK
ncbi:MAG: TonB family protein [Nitrospinota bacterium]|jgi:protein TonB|nr:TonB family protein [Nitrospinota bacterium]MDP7580761.1 TonB family protein [Nitrospinota bacterium]HJN02005.1 TonB family protein [Nitrospinota bacterium]|tara:strand:+ start:194 stop:667 length:474 start_codon:yes stop_codon:yes gene_type:complete